MSLIHFKFLWKTTPNLYIHMYKYIYINLYKKNCTVINYEEFNTIWPKELVQNRNNIYGRVLSSLGLFCRKLASKRNFPLKVYLYSCKYYRKKGIITANLYYIDLWEGVNEIIKYNLGRGEAHLFYYLYEFE